MTMMKAIKIDVADQTVSMIEIEKDNLEDLQKAVGGWITVAMTFPNQDVLYVDDEGLLKNPEKFQYWEGPNGGSRLFAGNGIIVGGLPNGDSCDAKTTVEDIKNLHFIADRATSAILAIGCDQ